MCKVDMKFWMFWKKQGLKSFEVDGIKVEVFWDFFLVKYICGLVFSDSFFVVVVLDGEVVLLFGDMYSEVYKKIKVRFVLIEVILVLRSEYVFGKKYYFIKV